MSQQARPRGGLEREVLAALAAAARPMSANEVLVESSARVPPVTWHFGGRAWSDTHPEHASW